MTPELAERIFEHVAETDRVVMSPSPLRELREVAPPLEVHQYQKPHGLWYACGNAWLQWVLHEMPEWLKGYRYVYQLEVRPEKMCVIRTDRAFADFEQTYKAWRSEAINWGDVYDDYAGIEICPYRWERRMAYGSGWYYTWDVASGCIWDPIAVKSIKEIKEQ